ncbi:putative transcription factor Ovo-like 1, partial [Tiliqua scincoides]|uniref:putative transcription factor Ovo-like 1 n=1 Tax=Tiliqua scincoides TaxID=71010 RepID=UPI00346323F1
SATFRPSTPSRIWKPKPILTQNLKTCGRLKEVLPRGVRPYKCDLCDKAFTQRCSLESHLKKIHGVQQSYAYKERRAKLYVCEDCGSTADSQEGHLRHLQERHPDSPLLRKASRKASAVLHGTASPTLLQDTPCL